MAKSDVLVRMLADTKNYDANIAKARRQLDAFKKDNLSMGGVLKQTSSSLVGLAARYASIGAAIGAFGSAIKNNIQTARVFEKSMSQLSSLTGMVGPELEKLKNYAIELGSSTTLTASEVADAFKMIGSQQPQLLQSGEALKAVTKQAITLSEAAGIDLATAAQTLSTSINQMGGDSNNAARYVNVLAAASQKGAGDIAWLGEAITKSGTTAKAVGTDYEELVANLEQLAKAGFDASTAGTALRSIIMNLEKQAKNEYKPSVVGLTTAFENLGKANLSVVEYQEIAGKMFASQAMALANAAGEARNLTTEITGTNIAEEQAKTNTDNLDGSLKQLSSAWEGFNLHINSSNGMLRDTVDLLKDVVTWADSTYQRMERWYNKFGWMLNPSKEGARDSFAQLAAAKWGNTEDQPATTGGAAAQTPAPVPPPVPSPSPTKKTRGGSKTDPSDRINSDFLKAMQKAQLGADELKADPDKNFLSVWAMASDEAKKKMLDLNATVEDLGDSLARLGEAKVMDEMKNRVDLQNQKVDEMRAGWAAAATAINSAGNALGQLNSPALNIMMIIGQAVATIGLAYAETLAKDAASKTNIYSFIAAAASAMISMTATLASLHSSTGYAEGGMIKGNSYSGDNIMANGGTIGLNAGEVVLNHAQQKTLARDLEGGGFGNLNIKGVLTGENIMLALDRHLQRSGKGELAVWR